MCLVQRNSEFKGRGLEYFANRGTKKRGFRLIGDPHLMCAGTQGKDWPPAEGWAAAERQLLRRYGEQDAMTPPARNLFGATAFKRCPFPHLYFLWPGILEHIQNTHYQWDKSLSRVAIYFQRVACKCLAMRKLDFLGRSASDLIWILLTRLK